MIRDVSTTPRATYLPTAKRRALLLVLLAAGLAFLVSFEELHAWLIGFLPAAEAVIRNQPVLGISVFILFAAASAMLAFVSSAVIVPVGVYVWGKAGCMLLLWVGWMLGGMCTYLVGRHFGRPVVKMLDSTAALERYESSISQRAGFGLVLLFLLALPSEVPGYLFGLARYRFWKYIAALALAELVYAVATTYLGATFIAGQTRALVGIGVLLAILAAAALHLLHRRVAHKQSAEQGWE